MAILKVKDANGNVTEIPAIRGKSAYAYAKDGGYTEQRWNLLRNWQRSAYRKIKARRTWERYSLSVQTEISRSPICPKVAQAAT